MAQISMVSISSHGAEKGKGVHEATDIMVIHSKWLHPNKTSWASDVNPLRASSMVKPRTREANISIKYKSKQS